MRELGRIPRRELWLLLGIVGIGLGIRIAYVVATHGHHLVRDELEYDMEGRFIAAGQWFWTTTPTGIAHAGMWKTPIYPIFVGILYKILGTHPDRVLLVQTLIGPVTTALTWLLGRRLFGPRVGLAAAAVVAVNPFAWQFETRLFAEALVTPLTLLLLLVLLERKPTYRRAALVGLIAGINILTRPSAIYAIPAIVAAFLIAPGLKRGAGLIAASLAVAALVVAPWTIRNYEVSGALVPLSLQDITPYGTFNDQSANDKANPFAWRVMNKRDASILLHARQLGDIRFRSRLQHNYTQYIEHHPAAVVEAFFWNGITRLWDLRRPSHVLAEVPFQGRSRTLTIIGLAFYWVLLPLAIIGLWLARRRRALVIPVVVLALSASVVFTAEAGTRYRAPFEPLVAVLACSAPFAIERARRARRETAAPEDRALQPV